MNDTGTDDRADEELRALLAHVDPEAGTPTSSDHLLDRVLADMTRDEAPTAPAEHQAATAVDHPSWLHRHWQGSLLVAASVATLALAAPTVLPGFTGSGGSDTTASVAVSEGAVMAPDAGLPEEIAAADGADAARSDMAGESGIAANAPGSVGAEELTADNNLVRSASLLVGTDEIESERDAFVATILALGGRVTSETVVTEGSDGNSIMGGEMMGAQDFARSSYPYPWYPTGPGIWLSVEVPVDQYDKAVAAARSTGEVVQMQQSSYDVGSQKSDVDARITALEASLARLTALMDDAKNVGDVIALEQAIASRQAELDSLRAQQRSLANQTAMSQISLTLMSPDDARGTVEPQPEQTWWESFLDGLGEFWSWLGNALLIVSPLLIAGAVIWWVRRRQARSAARARRNGGTGSAGSNESDETDPDTTA
jgi:hypothetical protein